MDHFLRDEDLKRIEGKVYAEDSDDFEISTFVLNAKYGPMDIEYEFSILSETGEVSYERISIYSQEDGIEIMSLIREGLDYSEYHVDGTCSDGVLDESMICETMISKPFDIPLIARARHSFIGITIATYDYDVGVYQSINRVFNSMIMTTSDVLDRVSNGLESIAGFRIKGVSSEPFESDFSFFYFDDKTYYVNNNHRTELLFFEEGFERGREYDELSSGTRRILSLLLMIESAVNQYYRYDSIFDGDLNNQLNLHPMCTIVVDEVGYSLHPTIIRKLVNYIDDAYNFVPLQMIFTVHNTEMMAFDDFSYDQIYLVDKDEKGSYIQCLKDIEGIDMCGHGSDLKNAYLEGRFGFVPRFRRYRRIADDS